MSGFNGSGTFEILAVGLPYNAGTVINQTVANQLNTDLAAGLSTCITKDGQTTVTADIPMNSHKLTGLGGATVSTDAVNMSQLQSGASLLLSGVSGTDTITGSLTPALGAYVAGGTYRFVSVGANTGAVVLSINGLGNKAITKNGNTALAAGDIISGALVTVTYDGTQFQLMGVSQFVSATITTATITTANITTANVTNDNATNLTVATSAILSYGTANGIPYLNGSKVLTSGSALTFDGTNFATTGNVSGKALIPTSSTIPVDGFYKPAANTIALATNSIQAWRVDVNGYQISDLANYALIQGASWASTSGTSHDWTGIPSWAKKITVSLNGVSASNSDNLIIQIGHTTPDTTSYSTVTNTFNNNPSSVTTGTTGFYLMNSNANASAWTGNVQLTNITGNTWVCSGVIVNSGGSVSIFGGSHAIASALDIVRITWSGTNTFDAGTVSILVE